MGIGSELGRCDDFVISNPLLEPLAYEPT